MNDFWAFANIVILLVVLLNLLLTLRIVQWLRAVEETRKQAEDSETLPELTLGVPAPDFRAKTLYGETIRLASYSGRPVLLIFLSPRCGSCRRELPMVIGLAAAAKERSGVETIVVSDSGSAETLSWISDIRDESGIDVNIPIAIAAKNTASSDILMSYNPRGFIPYYCYIDAQGRVGARDPLGMGEWPKLKRQWEDQGSARPFRRSSIIR